MTPSRTYRVRHETLYEYSSNVTDAYSIIYLLPRDTPWQHVEEASVVSEPLADEYDERVDVFGNRVVQLGLHRPHDRFAVTSLSRIRAELHDIDVPDIPWEVVARRCSSSEGEIATEIGPMLALTTLVAVESGAGELDALSTRAFAPGRPVLESLRALTGEIFSTFAFDPSSSDVTTPLDDVLATRRGVCQDFAHLAIAACRRRGLAARYVSGYIETEPPEGEIRSIGADASHAWASVWIPEAGWVDLDPTNDQLPPSRHVTVAWGRDYGDVAPVRGVVIGPSATQSMTVAVDVTRA